MSSKRKASDRSSVEESTVESKSQENAKKKPRKCIGSGAAGAVYEVENDNTRVTKEIESIADGKREGFIHRYAYQVNPFQVPQVFSEREENGIWIIEMEKMEGCLKNKERREFFRANEKELKLFK